MAPKVPTKIREKDEGMEPFLKFGEWFAAARDAEPDVPEAMCVASVGADGRPSTRMVLMKDWDDRGFVFYTNFESRKGMEIEANPAVALLFHWKSLKRQIRIEGRAEKVSDAEADAYFASRPKDAQIGAWASDQSRPMEGRFVFEARIAKYAAKYGLGTVPRPPHWHGWRIVPDYFEFWEDRPFRLHDRNVFKLGSSGWEKDVLFP